MKEFNWEDFQNKKIAVICKTSLELIWEREPAKEMTKAEIEKELGYKIKIID